MVNIKGIIFGAWMLLLIPIGFLVLDYNIHNGETINIVRVGIGLGLILTGLMWGVAVMWFSCDLPSPLGFLHRNERI